ncbi:MAG TPA: hypothetical protein VGT44_16605 [Ktedonobacteraceae bacterium]|nr:hypothetical protein [Ktedonobacteraceae bacterium]
MNTPVSSSRAPILAQPARDATPRRLIVTAGVVIFAIRDWSLWALLRDGPWGPPMRLVLGTESVTDAVDRTIEAVLNWPEEATLLQLKAGWQEQQVYVWGSTEEGAAVSLIHSVLLRANRDELRSDLHKHQVPSLRVGWKSVAQVEDGQHKLDAEVQPILETALNTLRSHVQRDPEIVLRYLADMGAMSEAAVQPDGSLWWHDGSVGNGHSRDTRPIDASRQPAAGDGILTLAEAALLYKAFFPPDEPIDLSNLRRRFLSSGKLQPLDEERPVRGKELDWRRVSRAYRYHIS